VTCSQKSRLNRPPSWRAFSCAVEWAGMTTWPRSLLPPRCAAAIVGMFIGQATWGLCLAAAYAGLGNYFSFIAAPIAIFGWLLIWGDNGPPLWAESVSLHVVFGLCFYGAIGALIGLRAKCAVTRRDVKAKLRGE
jgi:hypothetical protein